MNFSTFRLRKLWTISTVCAAMLLTTSPVLADDDDEDNYEVRYRHSIMESVGYSFGALALIFSYRVEGRSDQLVTNAQALAKSASLIPTLFPEGSEGGDAVLLIWREPEKVAKLAQDTVDATAALAAAAESGDKAAIAKAFKTAGDSCKACHERYKEDDD